MSARAPGLSILALSLAAFGAERAEGQLQTPLDILCTSHAQEYCVVFNSWEVTLIQHSSPLEVNQVVFRSHMQLYGSAVEAGSTGSLEVWGNVYAETVSGTPCATRIIAVNTLDGPGDYTASSSEAGCREPGPDVAQSEPRPPSPTDLTFLAFSVDGEFRRCFGPDYADVGDVCVSVPEPGTGFLAASGLLLLGLARVWRRRERFPGVTA